jgi:ubiquinone/menaquinone biosynthesis C-methylase UbiE
MTATGNEFEQSIYAHKYDKAHAQVYYNKHTKDRWRRLGTWYERQMLKRSLKQAGSPLTILDIPCGNGRFWPTMQHHSKVAIIGADYNPAMIDVAYETKQHDGIKQLTAVVASAYKIPLADNAVENICCLRLIHHMGSLKERADLLNELHRVTSNTVCLSLQVNGNWYSRSRLAEQNREPNKTFRKYIFYKKLIEQELRDAGFIILGYADKFKGLSAWRSYTLKKVHKLQPWAWHCPQCHKPLAQQSDKSYLCVQDKLAFKPNEHGVLDLSLRHAHNEP